MIRDDIIKNIETTLAGISIAGGYNYDIGMVTRESEDFEIFAISDYPFVIIQWSRDEKESEDAVGQHVMSTLSLTIQGGIYASSLRETVLNNFLEDIEKALCVDGTRGGNAIYTEPENIEIFDTPKENEIIFNFQFSVVYQYVYGSP